MKKVILKLDELSCPSCMVKINKAVAEIPGVTNSKVLFNASKVKLDLNEQQNSAQTVAKVVEDLGYQVLEIKEKELI
ncbi:Heavy-metal-associated domain-containing protein [Paucilactobacillus oligofermentans DSM 15707 = LMG 22743]|nr:heavy-metal-associated domain-containing protein [Paucilactobacillus oligofermentans]CUS25349.1 Heavy-metal-associated domain-containing protein [Paucilactobacillus oligofermentans DSM 15707 = LMG 22743]